MFNTADVLIHVLKRTLLLGELQQNNPIRPLIFSVRVVAWSQVIPLTQHVCNFHSELDQRKQIPKILYFMGENILWVIHNLRWQDEGVGCLPNVNEMSTRGVGSSYNIGEIFFAHCPDFGQSQNYFMIFFIFYVLCIINHLNFKTTYITLTYSVF